jgi:hypothetical protein
MAANSVDHQQWMFGMRNDGLVYSSISISTKIGMAVGTSLVAYVLAWAGFRCTPPLQFCRWCDSRGLLWRAHRHHGVADPMHLVLQVGSPSSPDRSGFERTLENGSGDTRAGWAGACRASLSLNSEFPGAAMSPPRNTKTDKRK